MEKVEKKSMKKVEKKTIKKARKKPIKNAGKKGFFEGAQPKKIGQRSKIFWRSATRSLTSEPTFTRRVCCLVGLLTGVGLLMASGQIKTTRGPEKAHGSCSS